MTRDNNETRKKANAVFFSVIMVLSMVAVGFAGFAGTAAAQQANAPDYDPDTPWQGQDVTANSSAFSPGDEYALRVVDDTNDNVSSSTFVEDLEVDEDSNITIETDDLDAGDYFLTGDGIPSASNTPADDPFEVRIQDLDAEFEDDTVADAGGDSDTEIEFDSNRARYTMNASADGDLDEEELFDIYGNQTDDFDDFDDDDRANVSQVQEAIDNGTQVGDTPFNTSGDLNLFLYEEGQDDDLDHDEKVGFYRVSDDDYDVDFEGIDDGDYEFLFETFDTEAEASAEITVEDVEDAELEFVDSTAEVRQGGVASITVEANDAADSGVLLIGEEDDFGYQMNVTIEDFNDDDQITVYFNTYTAGTTNTTGANVDNETTVWVDEDDEDEDAAINFDEDDNDLAGGEHPATNDLEFILSTGDYDMTVLADDDYEAAVDDPDDVGSLLVEDREDHEMNIWTASEDAWDDVDDTDDVLAGAEAGNITERDLVAQEDYLIHDLGQDSGLDGIFQYIEQNDDANITTLVESQGDNLFNATNFDDGEDDRAARLRIRETRDSAGPNVERLRVDADALEELEVVSEPGESAVYLGLDTELFQDNGTFVQDREIDEEDDYEFSTNFRVEDNWLLEFDDDDDDDLADLFVAADSTYDVEERTGEFIEDPYNGTATEDVEFTADTNVAPGTELDMRVRSTGDTRPSFINTESDLEVTQDEDVTGTFDLSDTNVGDTYDLTLRPTGEFPDDVEVEGEIVEEVDEETPTPTPTPEEDDDETPTPTPEEDDDTPTPDEDTDDDTPGFGAIVALVALIAAALLATRRRSN